MQVLLTDRWYRAVPIKYFKRKLNDNNQSWITCHTRDVSGSNFKARAWGRNMNFLEIKFGQ